MGPSCGRAEQGISVSYHTALKRILGWPKFVSNHLVRNIFNTVTFEHFMNLMSLKFFLL